MARRLPPGVVVDGSRVRVDLSLHPELAEEGGVLELPAPALILVRGKRKVRAFCAFCPHKPKKKRLVRRVASGRRPAWVCDAHDWTFDRKGRPTGCAKQGLKRYRVEQVGGALHVDISK